MFIKHYCYSPKQFPSAHPFTLDIKVSWVGATSHGPRNSLSIFIQFILFMGLHFFLGSLTVCEAFFIHLSVFPSSSLVTLKIALEVFACNSTLVGQEIISKSVKQVIRGSVLPASRIRSHKLLSAITYTNQVSVFWFPNLWKFRSSLKFFSKGLTPLNRNNPLGYLLFKPIFEIIYGYYLVLLFKVLFLQ